MFYDASSFNGITINDMTIKIGSVTPSGTIANLALLDVLPFVTNLIKKR